MSPHVTLVQRMGDLVAGSERCADVSVIAVSKRRLSGSVCLRT